MQKLSTILSYIHLTAHHGCGVFKLVKRSGRDALASLPFKVQVWLPAVQAAQSQGQCSLRQAISDELVADAMK